MRKLFIILLSISPLMSFGQLIDELPKCENGKLNFNEVIQMDSIKQNKLYLNSKQFFADAFKSAKDVIQLDDKEAGVVIGKAIIDINAKMLGASYPVKMWFTIKIQSKDGR
jgi:predicted membrane protein